LIRFNSVDKRDWHEPRRRFGWRSAADMSPPAVDLLGRNFVPPRYRGDAEAGRNDLIQYGELLRVRPKPPPLAPRKNLNTRHQIARHVAIHEISDVTSGSRQEIQRLCHRTVTVLPGGERVIVWADVEAAALSRVVKVLARR